jgi:hypothetical protein
MAKRTITITIEIDDDAGVQVSTVETGAKTAPSNKDIYEWAEGWPEFWRNTGLARHLPIRIVNAIARSSNVTDEKYKSKYDGNGRYVGTETTSITPYIKSIDQDGWLHPMSYLPTYQEYLRMIADGRAHPRNLGVKGRAIFAEVLAEHHYRLYPESGAS